MGLSFLIELFAKSSKLILIFFWFFGKAFLEKKLMATYQTIKASPVYGPKILTQLISNPLSLLDCVQLNKWLSEHDPLRVCPKDKSVCLPTNRLVADQLNFQTKVPLEELDPNKLVWPAQEPLNLNGWIDVLTPIEYARFYYSVAAANYNVRFNQKKLGPLTPLANTVALTALGAGAIIGGTVAGVGCGGVGGAMLIAGAAAECKSTAGGILTVMIGGPILTVGGAAITGIAEAVSGTLVAVPLVVLAAMAATYGVVKSVVLWPTTPFDKKRADNLEQISQMLVEFSQLIDNQGDFNQKYLKVLKMPSSMGQCLYDLFSQITRINRVIAELETESELVVSFLKAFREMIMAKTLIFNGKVFR